MAFTFPTTVGVASKGKASSVAGSYHACVVLAGGICGMLDRCHIAPATMQGQITNLLLAWNAGDAQALERLMPIVHDELQRLAHRYMAGERLGHVLQTTALVNEAYLRLIDSSRVQWRNRAHFFAVSAQLMRRILVDVARARNKLKRGGDTVVVSLDEALDVSHEPGADLIALDEALARLAVFDERKSKVVEMRFFGGLSVEETAEALHVAPITVMRDWDMAKVWLLRELSKGWNES
jgi:RNA polymerase sigma factor (TIGR02999 family)